MGTFCQGALGALARTPGVDVSAYAVTWRRRGWLPGLLPPGVRVRQRAMPARPLNFAWRHLDVPPCEWFVGGVSVVHGTNFVVPPARDAARVVTVHDLTTLKYPELCDRATLLFPRLVRRAVRSGAWVHTPSEFVASEVVSEFGADPSRVRAVHHGVPSQVDFLDDKKYRDCEDRATDRFQLPARAERYLLSIGTIEPRKDYPGLVRAFDLVAERDTGVFLVVAGADGWGVDAFERAVAASRFGERIVRPGYVADSELDRLLGRAAALVFPSVYEGFGFPPLQAMAAGVPLVATAVGAVPEVVGDAGRLVVARDVEALACAIEVVLAGGEEVRAMVERGKRRAAEFTWERTASGLEDLYRDALSDK